MSFKRVASSSSLVGIFMASLMLFLFQLQPVPSAAGQSGPEAGLRANPGLNGTETANISLANLEITQGISGVPLIRYKPTLVRVYLRCEPGCEPIPDVSAYLHASFSGPSLGTVEPINGSITVTDEEWESQRDDLGKTLNFLMPSEWTQGGINLDVYLKGSDNYIGGTVTPFGEEAEPLRVIYVPIRYQGREPDATRIRTGASWARAVFPTNRLVYVPGATLEWNKCLEDSFLCPSQNENALALLNELTTQYRLVNAFVYGWLPQDSFGGGKSDPSFLGGANQAAFGDDHPLIGKRIFAHELAHLLGRRHTNTDDCPRGIDPGSDWPYNTARIQTWGVDLSGLGWIAGSGNAIRPPDSTWDYMSYCGSLTNGDVWSSPFTFSQIYYQNFDPTRVTLQEAAGPATGEDTEYVVVSGLIDSDDEVTLDSVWRFSADSEPANPPPGTEYCVELRDEHDAALEARCFDLDFRDLETFEATTVDGFNLALTYAPNATRLVVIGDGEILESIDVSANAPAVTLLSPNGGEVWDGLGTQPITWSGSDADGDTLSYRVYYSDGSEDWLPLGPPTTESQLTVGTHHLPGSSAAKVRVVATDGFNNAFDDSDSAFSVTNRPPTAWIEAPAENAVSPSRMVILQGQGYDFEDGPLSDAELSWYSDRDGPLGEGQILTATLSLGGHELALQAIDDEGQVGTHTVTVRVSTPPQQVELIGPSRPVSPGTYTITGTIIPLTTTQPITAVWQATDHEPITQTGDFTMVMQNFTWDTPSVKEVNLTVQNEAGQAQDELSLSVSLSAHRIMLPVLLRPATFNSHDHERK